MTSDMTRDVFEIDQLRPSQKNNESNKKIYNPIHEIWSIDIADLSAFKTSNNRGYR